jgi:hypothetical protein
MSSPSNLYAEKVFAEHPTALWALDDKADFVSFINEQDRELFNSLEWTILNGTATNPLDISDEPFISSVISRVTGTPSQSVVTCLKNEAFPVLQMNPELETFSIGVYVYPETPLVDGFEIGYEYTDPDTLEVVTELKSFSSNIFNRWIFISETFAIPETTEGIRLVLRLKYEATSEVVSYPFLINGLSFGQWSENFSTSSLGVDLEDLTTKNIALPLTQGIEARAYGLQELSGYYIAKDNFLFAKNSGVPLVYGAASVTKLSPNPDGPSLIIPGSGLLNEVGQYKEYTVEMWIRLNSNTTENKRIFGPIASDDGLYVDGPFLTLKIGDSFSSHFVGEWFRPMLINIRVLNNSASLMINGEEVLLLNLNTESLELPKEFDEFGRNQDWLGFYAYDDVDPIEIDCVAIYPYSVPAIVAKRRWVYGQGVEFPENINTAYSGTSVFIDYPFANYANNYSYPDIGRWAQGVQENISVDNNTLSSPVYSLPEVVFSNSPDRDWYEDCRNTQDNFKTFITLKPRVNDEVNWDDSEGHIIFPSLNAITQDPKAVYGIFKFIDVLQDEQVLFQFVNELTNNYLTVSLIGREIQYKLKFGSEEAVVHTTSNEYVPGEEFSAGFDIKRFAESIGGNLLTFFGDKDRIRLYVGGNKDFTNTFVGNIYKVGICSQRNLDKIYNAFNADGLIPYENIFDSFGDTSYEDISSYDIFDDFGETFDEGTDLDGGAYNTTEWGTTTDGGLHNNTGSGELPPTPEIDPLDGGFYNTEEWPTTTDGGAYDLDSKLSIDPHIASYTLVPRIVFDKLILDIATDSYWEDYLPLTYFAKFVTDVNGDSYYDLDFIQLNINYPAVTKTVELDGIDYYDTSDALVKTYVTFQYLQSPNAPFKSFTRTRLLPADGIVIPDSGIFNTRYEVVDNSIIYLPPKINFNDLEMVVHVELQSKGILTQPVKIKKLQLASQSFNETAPNPIGTRFGAKMFPYKKYGLYFSYKERNPVSIYKGSTPYLYLTKNSGIQLRGPEETGVARGISIPVNESRATNYKVIAAQMAILQNQGLFPEQPKEIFELEGRLTHIKFFMVASQPDRKRARIYAVNADTGRVEEGLVFYINGNAAKNPMISVDEWTMLGISFSQSIDFRNYQGAFRINGPVLVNNVSYFQSTSLQEVQTTISRPWLRVKSATEDPLDRPWDFWLSAFTWNEVLVISSASFLGLDASNIYKAYTGTNKIIVDDIKVDSNSANTFRLKNYEYNFLKNVLLESSTTNPA